MDQQTKRRDGFREITVAEANIASERIEQFQRFLDVAISDDRITDLVPGGDLCFRAITVKGKPYQLTAFRPEQRPDLPWRVRITLGDLPWDRARELDADSGSFRDVDDAFDLVERRLRDAIAAQHALKIA